MTAPSTAQARILAGALPVNLSDFNDAIPLQDMTTAVAQSSLASSSTTPTTEPAKEIAAKVVTDGNDKSRKVKEAISGLTFLNNAMHAVATGSSLECFTNKQFTLENAPHVNHHHLRIAIGNFSIEGMILLKRFKWDPPFWCSDIIVTNLIADLKKENDERILRYAPFMLELIEAMHWDPYTFHQYYLTYTYKYFDGYDLTRAGASIVHAEHACILNQIQQAYGFKGSEILTKLDIGQLEKALESPFLKDFGLTEKEIKQKIAELKKVKK